MKKHRTESQFGQTSIGVWNYIPASAAIKRWVAEVARLNASLFSSTDWAMSGHAIVVEYDDFDAVSMLMPKIAQETGMELVQIDREDVCSFSEWLPMIPKDKPVMVYLEPGLWFKSGLSKDSDEHEWPDCPTHSDELGHNFRIELVKFLQTEATARPIVFVTAAQSIGQLDIKLRQADLFDRRIQLPELPYEDVARVFIEEIGATLLDETVTGNLTRLGCLVRHEFNDLRRRSIFQKAIKRLCWLKKRKAAYKDLVQFTIYGTAEVDEAIDPPECRRRHAVHEAGHALIVHLDSKNKVPPDYCSVIKRDGTHGMMARAFDDHELISEDLCYQDITHKVRVLIAGRAAEHLLLGPLDVSASGSSNDLEKATRLAGSLLGKWGHATDISDDMKAASNLHVFIGEPTDSEYQHVEGLIRSFLQEQFLKVLGILKENRAFLDLVVESLTSKTLLMKHEFLALHAQTAVMSRAPVQT